MEFLGSAGAQLQRRADRQRPDPADLGVQGRSQGEQWQLLVTAPGTCGEDCQQLVYLARQVNIALGREASRAGRALAASGELPADFANLVRQDYPRLQRTAWTRPCTTRPAAAARPLLWVVDPRQPGAALRRQGQRQSC